LLDRNAPQPADDHGPADGLERPPCPRCGNARLRPIPVDGRDHLHGTPFVAHVAECTQCGLWFQSPRLPRQRHGELYPSEYAPHGARPSGGRPSLIVNRLVSKHGYAHLRELHDTSLLARILPGWLLEWRIGTLLIPAYVRGGRLLDVGCGNGTMLGLLKQLGWDDLHGIEPDPDAAAVARGTGADVTVGAVEDVLPEYADASFDVILTSMVVEHLADPYAVLREIARKLKPGGQLLLSTVTRDSPDAAFFGPYWSGFDFPRHMIYFRDVDIGALFAPDFDRVERFAQAAPVDWIRSAEARGRPIDRILMRLGRRALLLPSIASALLGSATRVSFRARRRPAPTAS
jgi:SAM-dependent methyltransferase